jgi:hypothetical protein
MGLLDCLGWLHVSFRLNRRNGFHVSELASSIWIWLLTVRGRAPTSGGQYHWVSEFAPRSWQRFISYIVGKATFCLSQAYFL